MRDRNGNEAVRYTKEVDEIQTPRQGGKPPLLHRILLLFPPRQLSASTHNNCTRTHLQGKKKTVIYNT